MQGNEHLLGKNSLKNIDRIFANLNMDVIFFSTLTTPHLNLENIHSTKDLSGQPNPIVVFSQPMAHKMNL